MSSRKVGVASGETSAFTGEPAALSRLLTLNVVSGHTRHLSKATRTRLRREARALTAPLDPELFLEPEHLL